MIELPILTEIFFLIKILIKIKFVRIKNKRTIQFQTAKTYTDFRLRTFAANFTMRNLSMIARHLICKRTINKETRDCTLDIYG